MDLRLAWLVWLVHLGSTPQHQRPPPAEPPALRVKELAPNSYEVTRFEEKERESNEMCFASRESWVPFIREGQFVGLRVLSMHRASYLRSLGFKVGDVVTRVNDTALTTDKALLEAWQQNHNAPRIEVEIERDGRGLLLAYVLRSAKAPR